MGGTFAHHTGIYLFNLQQNIQKCSGSANHLIHGRKALYTVFPIQPLQEWFYPTFCAGKHYPSFAQNTGIIPGSKYVHCSFQITVLHFSYAPPNVQWPAASPYTHSSSIINGSMAIPGIPERAKLTRGPNNPAAAPAFPPAGTAGPHLPPLSIHRCKCGWQRQSASLISSFQYLVVVLGQ